MREKDDSNCCISIVMQPVILALQTHSLLPEIFLIVGGRRLDVRNVDNL